MAGALRFRERRNGEVGPLPDWWDGSEAPLVYLSFGTEAPTLDFFPGVYLEAIDSLAGLSARILVTIGNSRDPAELGPLPPLAPIEDAVAVLAGLAGERPRAALSTAPG